MPNRVIKDSIKSNDQIDSLTWFEEVVYYRLLVSADDYGVYDGRATLLKSELFPLKESVTRKAIENAIEKLVSVGLLRSYEVSGKPYLLFPSWEKHQRIRNKRSKYPLPPENSLTDDCLSNDGQVTDNRRPESESNPNPNPNPESEAVCAEPPDAGHSTPPSTPPPSAFDIPLNDGSFYNVPEKDIAEYRRLYPAVDVEQALRNMIGWCKGNPTRCKTRKGVKRFITGWLAGDQDKGKTRKPANQPTQYGSEDDFG